MTELRRAYESANKLDCYFEGATPIELWRAQSSSDFKREAFIMTPHPGYVTRDKDTGQIVKQRLPDVKIVERDGKQVVCGCNSTAGDYRGLSVFNTKVTWLGTGWMNYRIPQGTAVPPNLAVTKDHHIPRHQATHYTLAPKNDMPLDLFIQSLKVVASCAVRAEP